MKITLLLSAILITGTAVFAQQQPSFQPSDGMPRQVNNVNIDSLTSAVNAEAGIHKKSSLKKDTSENLNLIWAKDSLTSSDYMTSIERVNEKVNSIRDSAELGFAVVGLGRRIDKISDDIDLIRKNIHGRSNVVNVKNLHLYQYFISEIDEEIMTHTRFVGHTGVR